MICIDLSQVEARIDLAPASKVPLVILGCGPEEVWKPGLFKVLKEPTRRWRVACNFTAGGMTDLLRVSDGCFSAHSFPGARRGNALVFDFTLTKIGDTWEDLILDITNVNEPLNLWGLGVRIALEANSPSVRLTAKGLSRQLRDITWEGATIPTTRFDRLDSMDL